MQALLDALQFIKNLGPTVMLPIVIFFLALVLGAKPGRAFRSALTIGIAFVGINLIIGLLVGSLGGAAQAMVARTGSNLDVIDVGWPSAAAIAFGGTVGTWIIPVALLVNILMLLFRLTKTVNIDIWNFWHFAFTGALVYAATDGNLWLSIAAAAVNAAIVLVLADWTAPAVQKFYNVPGISIPHGFSAAYVPIAIPINKLLDKIPGVKHWDANPETIQKRFGVMGEPIVIGTVLGIIFGILAGYDITKTLQLAVSLGAVMLLMPRMVQILMEGLVPVSEVARNFMQKRFKGEDFYIGLDSAILIGHPAAIATALILVPITILLAILLGAAGLNRMLPFADLATIPFMVAMVAPITRGNIIRGVIIGTVVIAVGLLIGTSVAALHTSAALEAKFALPQGASLISSICDGTNPLTWVILQLSKIGWVGVGVVVLLLAGTIYFFFKNRKGWTVAAGGPDTGD